MNETKWKQLEPKRIVVRMPNWLGDLVMATPVLSLLRERYPEAEITAMTLAAGAQLLQQDPNIDQIFRFKRPSGWIHAVSHGGVVQSLRRGDYDMGLLLTNSFSSAWWFWRGKVGNIFGYEGHWRKYLLNLPLSPPANMETQHLVETYQQLLRPLGITESTRAPKLYLQEEEKEEAWTLLEGLGIKQSHIIIGINPGAAYGSAKCWLPSRFRHVAQRMLDNPLVRIVFFGDASQRDLVADICTGLSDRVVNLAGKTSLRQLLLLLDACSIVLTNDSGPMHIAAALGTPLLALFGSTNSVKTGPYQHGHILQKGVPCSPCYKRECPIDFPCMKKIEVDEVCQELEALIHRVKLV